MHTLIEGGTLVTPTDIVPEHNLIIDANKIVAIEVTRNIPAQGVTRIDARGMWVAPGLIDLHVHGGQGHDTLDATPEALHGMGRFFAQHGVTADIADEDAVGEVRRSEQAADRGHPAEDEAQGRRTPAGPSGRSGSVRSGP